ncbi:MAG: pantetheine-phosphate adenylyltransferase [Acidimicrobiales bacterium]
MSIALIPGSFDPVTNGHLDIVERTARKFDEVLVAVASNPRKGGALFTVEERVAMLEAVVGHLSGVDVESFDGLLADFAVSHGVTAIVKGLRAVSDFDYELQMAQLNLRLSGVDTLFMPTAAEHSFLSATLVREVASLGGDVSSMVPAPVAQRLKERYAE